MPKGAGSKQRLGSLSPCAFCKEEVVGKTNSKGYLPCEALCCRERYLKPWPNLRSELLPCSASEQ